MTVTLISKTPDIKLLRSSVFVCQECQGKHKVTDYSDLKVGKLQSGVKDEITTTEEVWVLCLICDDKAFPTTNREKLIEQYKVYKLSKKAKK